MTQSRFSPRGRLWKPLSPSLVPILALGGLVYPPVGLGIPLLMLVALLTNLRSRRSFCAGICPNGNFLGMALKPLSRGKALPRALIDPGFRRLLCGAMLFCLVGLLARGPGGLAGAGRVFWGIYLVALAAGILAGLAWKPRAWCAVCPLGTLQDSLGAARRPGAL